MAEYWDLAKSGIDIFKVNRITKSSFTTRGTNNKKVTVQCKRPFNLDFEDKIKGNLSWGQQKYEKTFKGPGIYVITFDKKVIYIGSYSSTKPNIINDRWERHIATMTNRGYRIGFNAKTKENRIPKNFKRDFDKQNFRYGDTGTVTTIERLKFASLHFRTFRTLDYDSLINNFKFYYKKLEKNNQKILESKLIQYFEPTCNFTRKREDDNAENPFDITVKDVEKKLKEIQFIS